MLRIKARRSVGVLSKAQIEVPEARYKADLELHDRYLGFSSELLRLALAGMAALGAIIGLLIHDGRVPTALTSGLFVARAGGALAMLTCAAGFALVHRYFASDGMYFHLRAIKILILAETKQLELEKADLWGAAEADENRRNHRFWIAGILMFCSAAFLIVAIVFLGLSISALLRQLPV